MSFKDDLQKVKFKIGDRSFEAIGGSFRGWAFFVNSSSISGGRRIVTHEFPGRNQPINEDQGRKSRSYSLECYVLGVDYVAQRDGLKQALEADGSGELIHPYYGKMAGVISDFSIEELKEEGQIAKLSISFIQDERFIKGPLESIERESVVLASAKQLGDNSKTFLESVFQVAGLAQDFVDQINGSIETAIDGVEVAKSQARAVAQFVDTVNRIKVNVDILVADIGNLFSDIRDLITTIPDVSDDEDLIKRSLTIVSYDNKFAISENLRIANENNSVDSSVEDGTTPQSEISQTSIKSFAQAMQAISLEGAANEVVKSSFESVQDAEETRSLLSTSFENFLETVIDDGLYQDIQNLQSSLDDFLDQEVTNLPNILEIKPTSTISSLALSWDLYSSKDGEQQIIDRNQIVNPLFISSEKKIEVLSGL